MIASGGLIVTDPEGATIMSNAVNSIVGDGESLGLQSADLSIEAALVLMVL